MIWVLSTAWAFPAPDTGFCFPNLGEPVPGRSAFDVPIDIAPRFRTFQTCTPGLIRLEGPNGPVPGVPMVDTNSVGWNPDADLQPDTQYTLTVEYVETQPFVTRFTTNSSTLGNAAGFVSIDRFEVGDLIYCDVFGGRSTANWSAAGEWSRSEADAYSTVEIRPNELSDVATRAGEPFNSSVSTSLAAGEEACFRVRLRTGNGDVFEDERCVAVDPPPASECGADLDPPPQVCGCNGSGTATPLGLLGFALLLGLRRKPRVTG